MNSIGPSIRPSIKPRIDSVVKDVLGADELTEDTNFIDDLGMDSLDQSELVIELEEEFDINIPDDMAQGWATLKDVYEGVESLSRPSKA